MTFHFDTGTYLPEEESVNPQYTTDEENQLALNAQSGDEIAFAQIFNKNRQWVYSKALAVMANNHHSAEDLTQDIFVKVWQKLPKWDAAKGNFYSWLYAVAHRACIDAGRKASREIEAPAFQAMETEQREMSAHMDNSPGPDRLVEQQEAADILEAALVKMTRPHHRLPWYLLHIEEYSIDEIAEIMDAKPNTVKVWIRRAKLTLRKILTAEAIG